MQRLQNALTKQLTDEHERIDLKLREKVSNINVTMMGTGRGSAESKEEEGGSGCATVRSAALTGQDADHIRTHT